MSQKTKVSSQVIELSNNIGSFIEYWGFKQIHGRIWTLIFLAKEPVDANFLIENLAVSKALVSMSIKDLLHYRVILEVEKSQPSTQKYTYNPDILGVITDVLNMREAKMLVQIKGSHELASRQESKNGNSKINLINMAKLGEMVTMADQFLNSMLALKNVDFTSVKHALNADHQD